MIDPAVLRKLDQTMDVMMTHSTRSANVCTRAGTEAQSGVITTDTLLDLVECLGLFNRDMEDLFSGLADLLGEVEREYASKK